MIDTDALEGVAIMIAIIMLICFVAMIIGTCVGITYGITCIWRETLIEDTFEVEVIDMAMTEDDRVCYSVLVKGVDLDGEEYCTTLTVTASVYSNISVGDVLTIRQKNTTQPIFGKETTYNLVEPASATN